MKSTQTNKNPRDIVDNFLHTLDDIGVTTCDTLPTEELIELLKEQGHDFGDQDE